MNLLEQRDAWAALPARSANAAVTLRLGVSEHLAPIPYVRERIKLQFRAWVHGVHTRRWLDVLNSHPAFVDYVRHCPRLIQKIYRPYLTSHLDMGQRLAVLASHYRFIFRHGLGATVAQAANSGVPLGETVGKTGSRYRIVLRAVEPMEREGELVLQLFDASTLIYSVAFTFSDVEGFGMVSIGCIQGPKGGDGRALIRNATRELHGTRPKQLLVSLVSQLGYELGCTQLRLVSNANRVVHRAMRQGRVLADYDQLWREMGSVMRCDGDFQLACAPPPALELDKICSKKRSEARKRHQLTVALAAATARAFCLRAAFAQGAVGYCQPLLQANTLPSAPSLRSITA